MPQATSTRELWFIWTTTADESADHAVSDDAMAAGITNDRGEYDAVCGARFLVAALIMPPAPVCPRCAALLRAYAAPPAGAHHPKHARRNRWRMPWRRHAH